MAKAEKKPGKYDITLKVNATFDQLVALSVQDVNLKINSRDEIEAARTDVVRFQLPNDYMTEESLTRFKDPALRELLVEVFWKQPENVQQVLDEAVVRSSSSSRFEQIRNVVLSMWVKDGNLNF